jgi:hypothetical protein
MWLEVHLVDYSHIFGRGSEAHVMCRTIQKYVVNKRP